MYFLSLLVAVFCFNLCYCQSEPNCEIELFTNTELQDNAAFINAAAALLGEGGTPTVVVSDFTMVCAAQGATEGLYRAVSVVVDFTVNGNEAMRQYQTWCFDNVWSSTENTLMDPGTIDPSIRTDCWHCREVGGVEPHYCLPCNAACDNNGLGRCTGSTSDDCCSFFLNNTCVSSCPNNYNASVNFTCECSICGDPGLAPNDDCSGCIVTDICLANNPCRNNGNCTLNGGPNSYTCECPPEFTGTNCDVVVPTSSSMSPTPTPTPMVCSVENCDECDPSNATCCRSCSPGFERNGCTCVQTIRCNVPNCAVCGADDCCSDCNDSYELDRCNCNSIEPSSTSTTARETVDRREGLGTGALAGIIVSIILGILVLLVLVTLVIYLIYYFVVGAGAAAKAAKGHSPFANGESHDNPLYLRPDEVTSDATLL